MHTAICVTEIKVKPVKKPMCPNMTPTKTKKLKTGNSSITSKFKAL